MYDGGMIRKLIYGLSGKLQHCLYWEGSFIALLHKKLYQSCMRENRKFNLEKKDKSPAPAAGKYTYFHLSLFFTFWYFFAMNLLC